MRYKRGQFRYQQSFLSLEDQISQKHVIRFIDKICEEFYTEEESKDFGFNKGLQETGRKAYHPSDLMKILVYGYFNGLSSSRKLERECGRNIELKWLTGDIIPDHKTISDFRKDNLEMVNSLFVYIIGRFKEEGLVRGKSIAVDGSKIKAYASQEINIETIKQKLEGIEGQVKKYLEEIATIDQTEEDIEALSKRKAELEKEIEELGSKKKSYEETKAYLEAMGETRICTTDPESKMMRGRYGKYWGYNVQTSVETDYHLITKIKVTDNQNDKGLLKPMVEASEQSTGQKPEETLADGGYYKISELEELEEKGTLCYVAINRTASQAKDQAHGLEFSYNEQQDRYYCGEGKKLDYWRKKTVDGRQTRVYKGVECQGCAQKAICTSTEHRMIHRNENQQWIDAFHAKMNSAQGKDKLIKRKSTAEHPFGTMKYAMGQIPLLLRGKKKVQTEMNLYAIGYNLKRYFNIQAARNQQRLNTKIRQAA